MFYCGQFIPSNECILWICACICVPGYRPPYLYSPPPHFSHPAPILYMPLNSPCIFPETGSQYNRWCILIIADIDVSTIPLYDVLSLSLKTENKHCHISVIELSCTVSSLHSQKHLKDFGNVYTSNGPCYLWKCVWQQIYIFIYIYTIHNC